MKLDEAIKFMLQCKFVEENGTVRQCELHEVPPNVEHNAFKGHTRARLCDIIGNGCDIYHINNDLLPKQKKYVPYATGDLELILSKGNCVMLKNSDVVRWISSVACNDYTDNVIVAGSWRGFKEMFRDYVYLDGTPFGKEI